MAFRVRILLPAALAMVCAAYGPELATEPQSGDNTNPVSLSQSANAEQSRDLAGMVAIGGFEGVTPLEAEGACEGVFVRFHAHASPGPGPAQ